MSHAPDASGDGIGDCRGLIRVLHKYKAVGFTDVWLAPFFKAGHPESGSIDGNYDVSDYFAIHPAFGTDDDVDDLVAEAESLGLRLLYDLVPAHTSDHHPHFLDALADPDSRYRNWYYFVEGDPSEPPTQLCGIFGDGPGSAWTWRPTASTADGAFGMWTLNLFYPGHPALNWHEPDVPAFVSKIMRHWADRGFKGARIDSASHTVLAAEVTREVGRLIKPNESRPYKRYEQHLITNAVDAHGRNMSAVAIGGLVAQLRRYYPDFLAIVENTNVDRKSQEPWTEQGLDVLDYGRDGDDVGIFAVKRDAIRISRTLSDLGERSRNGQRFVTFDMNHDFAISRRDPNWIGDEATPNQAGIRALLTLVIFCPVDACILYGMPLGNGIEDVAGDTDILRRAGLRRVIQWDDTAQRAFCAEGISPRVYPFPTDASFNVEHQSSDAGSTLNYARRLIKWRQAVSPEATFEVLASTDGVVRYRLGDYEVAINVNDVIVDVALPGRSAPSAYSILYGPDPFRTKLDPLDVAIVQRHE